jgi:hypothetical protein
VRLVKIVLNFEISGDTVGAWRSGERGSELPSPTGGEADWGKSNIVKSLSPW